MGDAARFDARFWVRLWRILLASGGMALCLLGANAVLTPFLGMGSARYLALLALVAVGIISYFGIGQMIGAFQLGEFKRAMRR
jgi:putative peptidoglycan lipid II flippase